MHMKNNDNNIEKINFSNYLIKFIQGIFIGLASAWPFFQVKNLKDCMNLKKLPFRKEEKIKNKYLNILTKSIRNEDKYQCSFLYEMLYLLGHRWTYIIGALIGFAIFFFIPFDTLLGNYPLAFYGSIIALSIGFILYEVYSVIKAKKSKEHVITSIVLLAVIVTVSILINQSQLIAKLDFTKDSILVFFIGITFLIGGFLLAFTGMSITSLIVIFGGFMNIFSAFNTILYQHNRLSIVAIAVIATLIGIALALLIDRQSDFGLEKSSINIAIYVSIIFLTFKNNIKEPYLTEISTDIAQWITIGVTIFVSLFIGIALTMSKYPFFNKKDKYNEENI